MPNRRFYVFNFVKTLVHLVSHILQPEQVKEPDENVHSGDLKNHLRSFLGRYKMELFFLFSDELIRFNKVLTEETLKELFESMMKDLNEDNYNQEVFAWYCVVLSFNACIAKKRNIEHALRTATTVILDTILEYDKNDEIKSDVVDDIKNNLKKVAKMIDDQDSLSR